MHSQSAQQRILQEHVTRVASGEGGYLVKTKYLGITFGGKIRIPIGLTEFPPHFERNRGLHTYHDSSFGKPRPMGGFVVMYSNGPANWGAGYLKIVPKSTHEAESAIASRATKATCFIRQLIINNGLKLYGPTPMLGDNDALWPGRKEADCLCRRRYWLNWCRGARLSPAAREQGPAVPVCRLCLFASPRAVRRP